MFVVDVKTGQKLPVVIEKMTEQDYEFITEERFWFDWKAEQQYEVYKLRLESYHDILGLVSIELFDDEQRIEIRLLAALKVHTGPNKLIDRIVGNLLAFVCDKTISKYGVNALVSLVAKTRLKHHYITKYRFKEAPAKLFIESTALFNLIQTYKYEK